MCQLCFVNLRNQELNRLWLFLASRENSKIAEDGFGFFTPDLGIFKTELSAANITNLGTIVRMNLTNNQPVLSHVRKATFTNAVKIKASEKSHPFSTDKLIFAHNGQLELKVWESNPDKIDSEIFLEKLDEIFDPPNNSLPEALVKTMDKFTGKFAFLIYDKINKLHYAVRGETANLHFLPFMGGYIINTEKDSLRETLYDFSNILQLTGWKSFDKSIVDPKQIVELPKESIMLLGEKGFEVVSEIKENKKVTSFRNYAPVYGSQRNIPLAGDQTKKSFLSDMESKIYSFLTEYHVGLEYLDRLLLITTSKPLLQCGDDELNYFADFIIPLLRRKTKKHVVREWKRLLDVNYTNEIDAHLFYGIQFPYMFENESTLRGLRVKLQKDNGVKVL